MKTIVTLNTRLTAALQNRTFNVSPVAKIAILVLVAGIALIPFKLFAQAPNISYAGPQVYLVGSSITPLTPTNSGGAIGTPGTYSDPATLVSSPSPNNIYGITLDSNGNLFYAVADASSTSNSSIYKLPKGSTNPVFVINADEGGPTLAMDPSNNLYIGMAGGTNYVEESPVGYQSINVIDKALARVTAVTCDAAGNVYAAAPNDDYVAKFIQGNGAPVRIGSETSYLSGVAVDASGNVYTVGFNSAVITEYKTDGTSVQFGSGLKSPAAIAIDPAGNLFVADDGNNEIKEYPAGGSAFITIGPGSTNALVHPGGIAIDAAGNLYVTDADDAALCTVKFMRKSSGYTISPALPAGLSLNINTGQITGTPTKTMAATTYTVSVSNSVGTSSTTLTITINPALPVFSYTAANQFFKGDAITPLGPTGESGVAPFAYSTGAGYTTSYASGFTNPNALAADISGDVYVADYSANAVELVTSPGGSPTIIGSGFNGPTGIALDAAGNIYVADSGNGAVKEISAADGTTTTIASGFSEPYGLVVDPAGNVYVSDAENNTITKIPAGGGARVTVGTGFSSPGGLAMDAAGNLYVADYGNNAVKEISAVSGTISVIGSGFNGPNGVASDAAGNLYVADYNNRQVKYVAIGSAPVVIGTGFNSPVSVALNGTGVVFVANYYQTSISQVTPTGGFFIGPNLPPGLSFNNTTGVISGTPTTTLANTYYAVSGYNISGGTTVGLYMDVAIGPVVSYPSPKTYSLGSQIVPLTPSSQNVAPQAYTTTTGFLPTAGKFITDPTYLSFDVAGNLYVTQGSFTYLTEIYAGGSSSYKISMGFSNPTALYVDPKSYIYLCDSTDNAIVRITPYVGTIVNLYTGLNNPEGIVTDVNGNIYESDCGSNTVNRFPAAGGTPVAYGTGFNRPKGLTFDAAGNLYVVDSGNNALKEVLASNGATITLITGLKAPSSVAIDATGNIFISDTGNNFIKELPAGSTTPITIGSSTGTPLGLIVDQTGNVDFGSFSNRRLYQITPTGGYYLNIPLPTGLRFNNATGTISGTPTVISGEFNYTVTAYGNGYGVPFNVNIAVVPPGNAQLSGLTINAGTLSPSFSSPNYNYAVSVPYVQSSVKLTPTAAATGSTITINGTSVTSGSTSGFLALKTGANTINVVVTAQDGVTTDTYTITVNRAAPSANASLANVAISKGTLTPAFASGTTTYSVIETNGTSSITLTPTTADATATITVNGTTIKSGSASGAITLAVGTNAIPIIVTAQDGTTKQTYTINVIRPSTNAKLASLTINAGTLTPAFNTNTTSYTVSVPYVQSSVKLTPTVAVAGATVKINGTAVASGATSGFLVLKTGANTINVVVTAQDGVTTDTYTLTVTRAATSNNAALSNIVLSKGTLTPAFASATTSYSAMETNGTTSVTLTPTTSDATATVTVNGTVVTSGKASAAITLAVGTNAIPVVVTAQDGTTKQTYTVNVIRPSTNAKLSALTISSGTLSPAFNTNTTAYTDAVTNATASITLTPTIAAAGATIKINGTTATSGVPSAAITLNVGNNTITTIVTAQDGTTTDTYTITVTRAAVVDNTVYQPVGVDKPIGDLQLTDVGINVHQGVSPNGDGINDFLQIDNINQYPDNKLSIMNRNGQIVYEAKGYDNTTKVFDGHSNKTGQMQLPGTYFYSLDYVVRGVSRHKTGFLVLKY